MKYIVVLIAFALSGCVKAVDKQPTVKPIVTPTKIDPVSLPMSASPSVIQTLHEVLGDSGNVQLKPNSDIVIIRDDTKVVIKPGTNVDYQFSDDSGKIVFNEPKPKITAKVFGLRVNPEIGHIDLTPDNYGTAHVEYGGIKASKRFSLSWEDSQGSNKQEEKEDVKDVPYEVRPRQILLFTASWCGPCQSLKNGERGFEWLKRAGWKIGTDDSCHIRVVDTDENPELTAKYGIGSIPCAVKLVKDKEVKRITPSHCGHLSDLYLELSTYSQKTASVWTFPGDSKDDLIKHLIEDGIHRGKFDGVELSQYSFDDLKEMHADDHEGVFVNR